MPTRVLELWSGARPARARSAFVSESRLDSNEGTAAEAGVVAAPTAGTKRAATRTTSDDLPSRSHETVTRATPGARREAQPTHVVTGSTPDCGTWSDELPRHRPGSAGSAGVKLSPWPSSLLVPVGRTSPVGRRWLRMRRAGRAR